MFGADRQLGPYKIEAPIGAGGMGEVFRATDTRLHRTVAIKILPHDKVAPHKSTLPLRKAGSAPSTLGQLFGNRQAHSNSGTHGETKQDDRPKIGTPRRRAHFIQRAESDRLNILGFRISQVVRQGIPEIVCDRPSPPCL